MACEEWISSIIICRHERHISDFTIKDVVK